MRDGAQGTQQHLPAGHALLDLTPHNSEHILTGPRALSYTEATALITEITGRPLTHRAITRGELANRFIETGIPADFATMLAALDADIRAGTEDRVTDTVEKISGRAPRDFREFIEKEM
ncbi:hypothetical protein [Nocardia sp. NPDC051570]|uniref:hypothetical protein n=1 Tax=Nocardia sp. NPDC051570 TaxID=3364324 RepID=UPI0037A284AF